MHAWCGLCEGFVQLAELNCCWCASSVDIDIEEEVDEEEQIRLMRERRQALLQKHGQAAAVIAPTAVAKAVAAAQEESSSSSSDARKSDSEDSDVNWEPEVCASSVNSSTVPLSSFTLLDNLGC